MKKRFLECTILILGLFAITSCEGLNAKKGKNVDSITFKNSQNVDVIINKNDTYDEMISKLDYIYFSVKHIGDDIVHPYDAKVNVLKTHETENDIIHEVEKNDDGEIIEKQDNYTLGNTKTLDTKSISETIYEFSNNNRFSIADETNCSSQEYNFKKTNVSSESKNEYKNQGLYSKKIGDLSNGGTIEYATTSANKIESLYTILDSTFDFDNAHKATYFSKSYNSFKEKDNYFDVIKTDYKSQDENLVFHAKNIMYNDYPSTFKYGQYGESGLAFLTSITNLKDEVKKYYELSFELTDKYIIIKNKINANENKLRYYGNIQTTNIEDFLESTDGSYSYIEVWLDYKNIVEDVEDFYRIGFAYFKYDQVYKEKDEFVYTADNTDYSKDLLENLNAIGKKATTINTEEIHIEISLNDITFEGINEKETEFINYCKNNNFLTKYNFNID
ncbi:MAG: hypothetical protein VZS44_10250 [Bacilli bacterium]|nr:hypothetical protein [Bacilli bacterium]